MSTSSDGPILDLTRDDHAYFFGFLQTDGHHSASVGNKGQVRINLNARDEHILWEFKRLVEPINSSVTRRSTPTNFAPGGFECASWAAGDLAFRRELLFLGLPTGRKSAIIRPPTVPYNLRGYLRGLVDGDGSVGAHKHTDYPFINFCSASRYMVDYFCRIGRAITGRNVNPSPDRRGMYIAAFSGRGAVALAEWLYWPNRLALHRKRAAAEQIAQWVPRSNVGIAPNVAWTPEEDALIASQPKHLAIRSLPDRTPAAVTARRSALRGSGVGIPDGRATKASVWTTQEDAVVMQPIPAVDVASELGRTLSSVWSRRWTLRRRGHVFDTPTRWEQQ